MRSAIIVAVSLLFAVPLTAQICDPSQTAADCATEKVGVDLLASLVANKSTGQSPELPGATSTVNDFLSLLRMSLTNNSLSNNAGGDALTLEINDFLGLPMTSGYKLQAVARTPKLFAKLGEALPEATRSNRISALEKTLNYTDDVSVIFTFSPMNRRFGRKPKLYWPEQSALFEAAKAGHDDLLSNVFTDQDKKLQFIADFIANLPADQQEEVGNALNEQKPVKNLDAATAMRLERVAAAAFNSQETYRKAIQQELEKDNFFLFADLVANQPQIYVNVEWTSPNELVGPRKTTGKATYEHGFVNVNSLRSACGPSFAAEKPADLAACYQRFLTPERLTQLRRGDRLAVSVEYTDIKDYKVVLDKDNVTFALPGDRKIVGSVALGRYLSFFADGSGRTRIDLNWQYEDYGNDPNHKDRSVATLTFSQKVAGDMVFSLGAVYANKPEFRGDVNKELSAHAGLSYKIDRQKDF
jgi:hypothetical protein